jgi:Zn-dependent protease
MNSSLQIATVAGIPIRVHITFLLILGLGAYQWGSLTGTVGGALFGVLLMVLLFVCVTLHELGHSVVALAFGIPVRQIVLLPLGGVAQISRNPEKPWHEFLIAIAGPAVNVVLAGLLLVVAGLAVGPLMLDPQGLLPGGLPTQPSFTTLVLWLLAANVSLVLFNLIPAFPLDGGRVLRALLAMALGYPRATRLAVAVGQLLAVGLGAFGVLSGNFVLTLVAVFIFFGAGQETAEAEAKTVLQTLRVGDAYNKHALALQVGDRASRVVDYILTSYQPDFAVLHGRRPIGIVTRADVMKSLADDPADNLVTEIMQREFLKVDARKTLDEVRREMAEQGGRLAAVYDGETYLGLVSQEDISEAFAVLTFLQRQQQARLASARTPAG